MPTLLKLLPPLLRAGSALAPGPMAALAWRMFRTPRRLDAAPSARAQRLHASAQTERLPVGDAEIQLYRWPAAPTDAPTTTVLLVHGWEGDALNFAAFVEPLRRAGCTVVALDGPAHGASSGKRSDALRHTEAVAAAVRHLGGVDLLVGHSFGGVACALAVAGLPGLVAPAPAAHLVLISAPDTFEAIFHRFARMVGFSRAVERRIHRRVERLTGQPASFFSTQDRVREAAVPTLVVHDRDDKEIPFAEGEAIGAAGPHVAFHATDGLGHRRILRAPAVVKRIAEAARTHDALA